MDAMTERAWEEEFVRQYPAPDAMYFSPVFIEEVTMAREEALLQIAGYVKPGKWSVLLGGESAHSIAIHNRAVLTVLQDEIKVSERAKARPYIAWRDECKARFEAIFRAEPSYAIAQLKNGNLFIEHKPADSECAA